MNIEKARKRLQKLGPFYLVEDWRPDYSWQCSTVLFRDRTKNQVKMAVMYNPYWRGLSVFATYGGREAWWFQSSGSLGAEAMDLMRTLHATGTLPLPTVDLDALSIED